MPADEVTAKHESKHNHEDECAHKELLYFCKKCELVECQGCGKEFGRHPQVIPFVGTTPWTFNDPPNKESITLNFFNTSRSQLCGS